MGREPIVTTALIVSFVTAMITLLVAFGVPITEDMKLSIIGVTAVIAPILVIWSRRWTTPTADPRDDAGNPLVPMGGTD